MVSKKQFQACQLKATFKVLPNELEEALIKQICLHLV